MRWPTEALGVSDPQAERDAEEVEARLDLWWLSRDSGLREREALVLRSLETDTYSEVAATMGVTRERVRQIRDASIRRLRWASTHKRRLVARRLAIADVVDGSVDFLLIVLPLCPDWARPDEWLQKLADVVAERSGCPRGAVLEQLPRHDHLTRRLGDAVASDLHTQRMAAAEAERRLRAREEHHRMLRMLEEQERARLREERLREEGRMGKASCPCCPWRGPPHALRYHLATWHGGPDPDAVGVGASVEV